MPTEPYHCPSCGGWFTRLVGSLYACPASHRYHLDPHGMAVAPEKVVDTANLRRLRMRALATVAIGVGVLAPDPEVAVRWLNIRLHRLIQEEAKEWDIDLNLDDTGIAFSDTQVQLIGYSPRQTTVVGDYRLPTYLDGEEDNGSTGC